MIEHVAKIDSLVQQMRDVGLIVDDVTVMTKILGNLLSKYNALKAAWDNVDKAKQQLINQQANGKLSKEKSRFIYDDKSNETKLLRK